MSCDSYFEGVVFSGVGEGAFYVSLYSRRFLEKLGFKPYPGTLNLRLLADVDAFNQCLSKANPIIVEPPVIPGVRLGVVYVYPVEIQGYFNPHTFMVRPQITVYRGDVAELIADVSLREELGLDDGSKVRFRLLLHGPPGLG
jgi:riboflavin kinase